uniref:Uncharacterized protein n=1 Tax=Anguilla anguilla TaxID=7936 RepID=A0A0E9S8H4_ANGAN
MLSKSARAGYLRNQYGAHRFTAPDPAE